MAGTKAGGLKTRATNLKKYGKEYYRNIGKLGGSVEHPETRPFMVDRELARRAGTKGGMLSRKKG